MTTLKLFQTHWRAISLTYGLTVSEKLCLLTLPAMIGLAIDDLLKGMLHGLISLLIIWFVQLILCFVRQRYDTRIFSDIYAGVASRTALLQTEQGHGVSKVSARVELARDLVNFLEFEVPAIFRNLTAVFGSLILLFTYDREAGWMAALVLVPMLIANKWYWSQAQRLNRGLNNQIEREVDILQNARSNSIERHFQLLRRWKVALSDAQNLTWVVTELATIVALVCMLWDFTHSPAFSAGAAYAMLAYMRDYVDGLNDAPYVVNSFARMRDTLGRLSV
jgi:ABC-type multidrug transport system fused ATPase/permease subunit